MTFSVNTETMASSAARVGVAAERIDELLEQLTTTVNALLDHWQGDGADAHRAMHQRFNDDVRTINTSLREVQSALQQTHTVYVQQESDQTDDHTVMRNQILA